MTGRRWAFVTLGVVLLLGFGVAGWATASALHRNAQHSALLAPVPASAWSSIPGTEVLKTEGREGTDCCEPSYGGMYVSLRLPGVHSGAEAIRRVAHGMQRQGWHLKSCDKPSAMGWQNCALWKPGLGAAVHALAHRRLRDGADVWVDISKTSSQASP